MLFTHELTISANTTKADPFRETLHVTAGTITEVSIFFPYKRSALVGVRIIEFEHQVWPTNPDAWIVADDAAVDWDEAYDLQDSPYALHLEGYNLSTAWPHTVYFRFSVIEEGALDVRARGGLLGRVADFLGIR